MTHIELAENLDLGSTISAYDITSGVHTNAHEDTFSVPQTNVRLVAIFGAFEVLCTSDNVTSFLQAKIVTLSNCHINQHY